MAFQRTKYRGKKRIEKGPDKLDLVNSLFSGTQVVFTLSLDLKIRLRVSALSASERPHSIIVTGVNIEDNGPRLIRFLYNTNRRTGQIDFNRPVR